MCWFPSFRERNNVLCFLPFTIRPFLPRPIGKMRIIQRLVFLQLGTYGPGLRTGLDWGIRVEYTGLAWLVVCMIAARGKPWEAPIDPFHGFPEHFSPWNDCNEFQGGSVLGSHETGLWGVFPGLSPGGYHTYYFRKE